MSEPDMLETCFGLQRELQIKSYGKDPGVLEGDERIQFIKDMNLAIQDELHEFLNETGWKPWATSRHVNEEAAKGELVDAFHFFMNLCMVVNLSPSELYTRYIKKRLVNAKRQVDGYDGVSTKCPECKRAYDDSAVTCKPSNPDIFEPPNGGQPAWCGQAMRWLR